MIRWLRRSFAIVVVSLLVAGAGCSGQKGGQPASVPASPTSSSAGQTKTPDEHAHKQSAHGGIIVPIGRDSYHAEAVFEKGGILRLYLLGQDEAKVLEIDAQPLTGFAKTEGGMEATSFVLRAEPQTGDAAGKTSQFVGHLPRELWGQPLDVTIPSIRIGSERFRVGFSSAAAGHAEATMPEKVADDDERKLYLTPGGKYTEADIKANGGLTASQRFKGLKPQHDARPAVGEKVCPISETKPSAKFTWVIGGQPYEFCCPPCIDEFLKQAKEKPGDIKAPSEYRKK